MADHDGPGQGASAFRAFLRQLPDDIAAARDDGFPIALVTDRRLAPASQRLMDSLGVDVLLVNQGIRTAEAAGGGLVVIAAWCETCQLEAMPNVHGCCSFCGTQIVDEDRLSAKAAIAALTPKGADVSSTCKIDGCEEPPVDTRGPYAGLCAAHKDAKRQDRSSTRSSRSSSSGNGGAIAEACKALHAIGKRLDRARTQLADAPATDEAKAAFDEAARRASATPTPEALKRVQDAAAALQQVQPKRAKLEEAHDDVLREFKERLGALMALVR